MRPIYIATEDPLSAAVIDRLVGETQSDLHVAVPVSGRGFGGLRRKLPELIRVAHSIPVILLTDLDRAGCAPSLIADWFGQRAIPPSLLFRVAVREVEAWLLADRERFAEFARIPLNRFSDRPEALDDPKQTLLNLVWRYSPSEIKHDIVTRRAGGAHQGLGYNERLTLFVQEIWQPRKAVSRSNSLERARQRIDNLARADTT